jgi:hypothetical protein
MSILNEIDAQINNILSFMKQKPKSTSKTSSSNLIFYENKNTISLLRTSINNNQKKSLSNNSFIVSEDNQNDSITAENFPFTHLCNRDVHFTIFISVE